MTPRHWGTITPSKSISKASSSGETIEKRKKWEPIDRKVSKSRTTDLDRVFFRDFSNYDDSVMEMAMQAKYYDPLYRAKSKPSRWSEEDTWKGVGRRELRQLKGPETIGNQLHTKFQRKLPAI